MNPLEQPTPRTDAIDTYIRTRNDYTKTDHEVWREHARTLERELTETERLRFGADADRRRLRAEVERLNDIINRASVQFFHDGSDGETAAKMLTVLNEAKP